MCPYKFLMTFPKYNLTPLELPGDGFRVALGNHRQVIQAKWVILLKSVSVYVLLRVKFISVKVPNHE